MKVVCAPDSFKESMSAAEAAAAMTRGVRSVFPDAQCVEVPMADGGEGIEQVLENASRSVEAGIGGIKIKVGHPDRGVDMTRLTAMREHLGDDFPLMVDANQQWDRPTAMRMCHPMQGDFFQWDAEIRRLTVYHLDATGWGVLAAVCNKWYRAWWKSRAGGKAIAGAVVMLLGVWLVTTLVAPTARGFVTPHVASVASITLMAAGTFLCMPWLTQGFARSRLLEALTGRISMYSYSIYLSHFPLIFVFMRIFPVRADSAPAHVAAVVLCWLLAVTHRLTRVTRVRS